MEIVKFVNLKNISSKIEALFESEKQKLLNLFDGVNVDIEHIGGTSVPGLITRGDLDINIRVQPENFKRAVKILKMVYEINQSDNWSSKFASFKDDSRNLGIQLTVRGSTEDFFVAQREYLKKHPETVSELNTLKEGLEGKSMDKYQETKDEFFNKLNANL